MKIRFAVLISSLLLFNTSKADVIFLLNGMPTNEQVFNKIKGANQKDTYQKQIAAFKILTRMLNAYEALNGNAKVKAPASKVRVMKNQLRERYNSGSAMIHKLYGEKIKSLTIDAERKELFNVTEALTINRQFTEEIIKKLLAPQTQEAYYYIQEQDKNRDLNQKAKEKRIEKEKEYRYNYKFIDKGVKPTAGGLIIIFIGILIWRPANRTIHKNNADKFEGRLQNISYDNALKFDRSQKWATLRVRIAFIVWIIGAIVLITGVSNIFEYFG